MADRGRVQGERVYCHSCANEWDRNNGGLTCPFCDSEFTEIVSATFLSSTSIHGGFQFCHSLNPLEPDADTEVQLDAPSSPQPAPPSNAGPRGQSPFTPPLHPLHDHNPWQNEAPDPDEDDITTFEFNSRPGGTGSFSFTARTVRLGGGAFRNRVNDPAITQVERDFGSLLTNIMGFQPAGRSPGSPDANRSDMMPGGFGMFGLPSSGPQRREGMRRLDGFGEPDTFSATGRIYPRGDAGQGAQQPGSINECVSIWRTNVSYYTNILTVYSECF